jgi:hypothetical protein
MTAFPSGQLLNALLMLVKSVAALPEGVIVAPDCPRVGGVQGFGVVSPSGKVAGSPALDQLIARLDDRTLDHCCPNDSVETNIESPISKTSRKPVPL